MKKDHWEEKGQINLRKPLKYSELKLASQPPTHKENFDNNDRKLKKVKIISHKTFLKKILFYLIFYKFISNILRIIFIFLHIIL